MSETDALFDLEPTTPPPPPEKLSPDRRRTIRQAEAITRGVHPLALLFPRIRLTDDPHRTCGNCRFRHPGEFPKCSVNDWARATHSAASDVRAWWPGCTDHVYRAAPP